MKSCSEWGRAKARERYDSGGKVTALPFGPNKTADVLERLSNAGIMNKNQATDFAAHRLKAFGVDPVDRIGREAPDWKNRGGRT